MTIVLRLIDDENKGSSLSLACSRFRHGGHSAEIYEIEPERFRSIPTSPFAYWVGGRIIDSFLECKKLEGDGRRVERGLFTGDDARFLRCYWEIPGDLIVDRWGLLSKGGAYSPFYFDVYLCVKSAHGFAEIHESIIRKYEYLNGNSDWVLHPECSYKRAGLTYPLRTTSDFSARVLPAGCFWTNKGISIFESDSAEVDSNALFFMLGVVNSRVFREFLSLRMGAAHAAARSYEEGIVASMPWPPASGSGIKQGIAASARRYWQLGRQRDSISETSHAFVLPMVLRSRWVEYDVAQFDIEMERCQAEIDDAAFELYGFTDVDRQAVTLQGGAEQAHEDDGEDEDAEPTEAETPPIDAMLSWAVGVAFGRFDWRLATGERTVPSEPEPFDPLPAKSPGMLPDGAEPFYANAGTLVDDHGHPHDLARLIEEVLARVDVTVPDNVRRWLRRDFFAFHSQRYSKSRRKAPIYWPLSTTSGSYTLWVYYPSLTSQTLYTAINDLIEPKLKQFDADITVLRNKGAARTRDDEKQFETLQAFELELIELRDTLLRLAPTYNPNLDDGVQISAAPLWPLFQHKPWQKVLRDTWAKLEEGDYDWAHLAMNYWPGRVGEKCKTDRSLAIAHGLEDMYIVPEAKPKKARGKKKAGGDE